MLALFAATDGSLVQLAITVISLFVGVSVFALSQSVLTRGDTRGNTTASPAGIDQNQPPL